jgi:hypothetical protein
MALENQGRIKEVVDRYGKESLVVVLGVADVGVL